MYLYNWLDQYDQVNLQTGQLWDQATYRSAIWVAILSQSLSFYILPDEVNIRTTKPWIVGRGLPAYVIHGRFDSTEYSNFLDYLNSDLDKFRTSELWLESFPESTIRPRFDRTYN